MCVLCGADMCLSGCIYIGVDMCVCRYLSVSAWVWMCGGDASVCLGVDVHVMWMCMSI